ncbi:MAG: hypothetical protein WKG07_05395 [Hymenobacter sp.]
MGYLTLLLSLGTFGLLLLVVMSLLPELRRLRRRVRTLEAEAYYPEADAPAAAPTPAAPEAGFFDRLRSQATGELPADQYEDEEGS